MTDKKKNERLLRTNVFVICENIIIDQANRYSLINIFNHIQPPSYPINIGFQVFISLVLKESAYSATFELEHPNGTRNVLNEKPTQFLLGLPDKVEFVFKIATTLEMPGIYKINVYLDKEIVTSTELIADELQKEQQQP